MKLNLFLALLLFSTMQIFSQSDTIPKPRKVEAREKSENVSIISLIANPEKFKGKRVTITGYASIEFEGTAIYLNREDFDHGIRKNAIFLLLKDASSYSHYHKEYVSLEGTFYPGGGHMGAYNGVLDNVKYIQKL